MPSLDSVTFDASSFRFEGEQDQTRVWRTSVGDGVGLYYFPVKPDIAADLHSIDSVRSIFRSRAAAAGAAIIEVDSIIVDQCIALRQIVKLPQQPHGMAYAGSLLLPFRDFSFVIKVQCHERGLTGVRDAIVADEAMADGRVTIDSDRKEMHGWMRDPYNPELQAGFHRNLSEAPEYDERFPDHPLSRLRLALTHLERTLRVTRDVQRSPGYVFQS